MPTKTKSKASKKSQTQSPKQTKQTEVITMENKTPANTQSQPKTPVQTSSKSNALEDIANGFGFATFWKNLSFGYRTPADLEAKAVANPLQSFVSFDPHTVTQAIQLACNDTSFKKIKHNDEKVEARLVHKDETAKTFTVEFLAYEKVEDKRGKRTQVDRVVLEMNNGSVLDSGSTDISSSWLQAFQKHLDNWSGNDVYTSVIKPYLKEMKAFRLSTSNYYVMNNARNQALLTELRTFLESVGYNLYTLTQAKDSNTQAALSAQVQDMLGDRLSEVNAKVQEWRSKNRVHGRSETSVMSELGDILTDAIELEKNLETDLKDLKSQLEAIRTEAEDILSGQAPSGVNPAVYAYFKKALVEEKSLAVTEKGMKFMITVGEDERDFLVGNKLKVEVEKALRDLGYYAFSYANMIIINPLAELEGLSI